MSSSQNIIQTNTTFQAEELPEPPDFDLATIHHATYGEAHLDMLPQLPMTKLPYPPRAGSVLFASDFITITQTGAQGTSTRVVLRLQSGAFTIRKLLLQRTLLRPRPWEAFIVVVFEFTQEPEYTIITPMDVDDNGEATRENVPITENQDPSAQYTGPVNTIRLKSALRIELNKEAHHWTITNAGPSALTANHLVEQLRQLCCPLSLLPSASTAETHVSSLIVKLKIGAPKSSSSCTKKRTRAQIEAIEEELDKEHEGSVARYRERKRELREEWKGCFFSAG